jgi:hypothetical protein
MHTPRRSLSHADLCPSTRLLDRRRAVALAATLLAVMVAFPPPAAAAGAPEPAVSPAAYRLQPQAPGLDPEVLRLALAAHASARANGGVRKPSLLTIIDYSLPSTQKRLWVLDLDRGRLLYHELVAHGVNTGGDRARSFSNQPGSRQSSLGLFRTAETYYGRNGYSLRLDGLERGVNHLARARAIVIHGADYVSQAFARANGRLGRSWGCPALPNGVAREVIDTIAGGSLVFSYYPDREWLGGSQFLNGKPAVVPAAAP